MLFNSLHFLFFLPVVLILFYRTRGKAQRIVLFLSSVYFYSILKIEFLPLLFTSLIATYLASRQIETASTQIGKKLWLTLCLLVNLGILIFFKYTDFLRSIYFDLGFYLQVRPDNHFQPINLVLPLGISFYTFQAIAYSIDVYRGVVPAEKRFFRFALFLVFFPQLVAGPIIRAAVLIPQFFESHAFKKENLYIGMQDVTMGIFKKTIIADPLATLISPVYAAPNEYNYYTNILVNILFSIQIYCDFSGYSDIAIGVGKMMGFEIPINFRRPFLSASTTEIWQRWHISLSTWLRDYVYIPLGGNRVGKFRNYFNLFATMIIGGIWHGAAWTFVIWGLIHAVFQIIERLFVEKGYNRLFANFPRPVKIFYAFFIFTFAVIFFRGNSMPLALQQLDNILSLQEGQSLTIGLPFMMPIGLLFLIEFLQERSYRLPDHKIFHIGRMVWMSSIILIALMIYTVTVSPQFYYFQF